MELENKDYQTLVTDIGNLLAKGRSNAARSVNTILLQTNFKIGQYIVEFEQNGQVKANYGAHLVKNISKDLTAKYGKGFSLSNVKNIRAFYIAYQKSQTLSNFLNWGHYCELLSIGDLMERNFYEKQTENEQWSVRELKRQKKTSLFLRLAVSKDKADIIKLAQKGIIIEKPEDLIREPYVLDFLKIPTQSKTTEKVLEKKIIEHLQQFLLELGKGFAFVGRQYRITIDNQHYFIDLVFYHCILKCFVLIDLKREKVTHQDIGQMNMYLGYFENEIKSEGDTPPIGIVLTRDKNELLVKYAMHGISTQLFVSKYQLYLPDKETLQNELNKLLK